MGELAPPALAVIPEAIPTELRVRRQFVAWDWWWRHGRWAKVPISPATGRAADSTNPATWDTFEHALATARARRQPGIGFVFSPDDPYAGVDLDKCRDSVTGVIAPWAREIVDLLDSYSEVSPSGTGIKGILRARIPGPRRKNPQLGIEMYDSARFFTLTGHAIGGSPAGIPERQDALRALYDRIFPARAPHAVRRDGPVWGVPAGAVTADDGQLLARARAARNGSRFTALWAGDASGYGSPSEADAALCALLAFWTGPDPARIDHLFRQSGLYRAKWEREDYRARTIALALASGRSWWPQSHRPPAALAGHAGRVRRLRVREVRRGRA